MTTAKIAGWNTAASLINTHRVRLCEAAFVFTTCLSATLLFCIQPMFSKMALPVLGGSSSVWSIAMVVYQGLLMCGYLYAHALTTWLSPKRAAIVHGILLIAAFCTLPIGIAQGFNQPPEDNVAPWLIALFIASIGLPFFALSANSPLLQAWFARTGHPHAQNPYPLYSASNIGSFAVLLAYPILIEPLLGADAQAQWWRVGFGVLIAAIATCSVFVGNRRAIAAPAINVAAAAQPQAVTWRARFSWLILSFIPSGLLVAVTAHISTDIAAVPLLWIAPLALFLLTFVYAFSDKPAMPLKFLLTAQALTLPVLGMLFLLSFRVHWMVSLAAHLAAFFIAVMVCHTILYGRRPGAAHVTQFYAWMSLGGVLGGCFAALAAPLMFPTTLEYPLLVMAAFAMRPDLRRLSLDGWKASGILCAIIAFSLIAGWLMIPGDRRAGYFGLAILSVCAILLLYRKKPEHLLILGGGVFLLTSLYEPNQGVLLRARSFYGVHKVVDIENGKFRVLFHGTTAHGGERLIDDAGQPMTGKPAPLTYYYDGGPYAEGLKSVRTHAGGTLQRVGLVGLGAGALTCHRAEGEDWDLYELDPAVIEIARNDTLFHAVSRCAPQSRIIQGDARLTLQSASGGYNLLMLDAFTSDAVPVHLITQEAMAMYADKLTPHGVMAFNISNRNLELASVIAGSAAANGFVTIVKRDQNATDMRKDLKSNAEIAMVARSYADFGAIANDPSWRRVQPNPGQRVWTDDYSNIVGSLIRKLREGPAQPH